MLDGLYRAQFATPLGVGAGVVDLLGAEFRGGDSAIAYVGRLTQVADNVTAEIKTFRHTPTAGGTVLGSDDALFTVRGKATSDISVVLKGNVPGTTMPFTVKLDRLAD